MPFLPLVSYLMAENAHIPHYETRFHTPSEILNIVCDRVVVMVRVRHIQLSLTDLPMLTRYIIDLLMPHRSEAPA